MLGEITYEKNILIASYNLDFGGIETSLINLLKNINFDKYKVTLVLEKRRCLFKRCSKRRCYKRI